MVDSRSLKLAAFVARNGPLDHFVRLSANRFSPCIIVSVVVSLLFWVAGKL
jgi:hypothetical protein